MENVDSGLSAGREERVFDERVVGFGVEFLLAPDTSFAGKSLSQSEVLSLTRSARIKIVWRRQREIAIDASRRRTPVAIGK